MEPPRESTLYQHVDVPYKKPATALAVDSTGAFAALGGKKGIYITDLEEPWDPPTLLHHGAKQTQWDTNVIQWNPHAEQSNLIASAANRDVFIWNVNDKRTALQASFAPHSRPVSDLCWALSDPNVLATCSADMYVILSDVRAPKSPLKLKAFCAWTAGATMVRWNRRNPRLIASVHDGDVFVWDVRKESAPITKITAHKQISSVDWSYHSETQLVTSSSDRTVKFWDYQQPTVVQAILQTGNPVSKVRYTPFGRAILTVSQRSDYAVRMWSLNDLEQPVYQFMGHKDIVSALDWRTCDAGDDYEYQLLSWSKDNNLRFWPIDLSLINAMQARESYGGGRSVLPSASSSLTKDGFGSSLGIYPSVGTSTSLLGIDRDSVAPLSQFAVGSPKRNSLVFGSSVGTGGPGSAYGPQTSTPGNSGYSLPSTITNLEQELAILQRRPITGVTIEESSLSNRTLQVRLGRLPYMMRLKVTFPSMYPNLAAPSFEFLPITDQDAKQFGSFLGNPLAAATNDANLPHGANNGANSQQLSTSPTKSSSLFPGPSKLSEDEKHQLKIKAKHLLVKVAYAFVSISLVCVDPCCTQLLELLESFHADPKMVSQPEDPDRELSIRPEEYYKSGFSLSSGSVPSTPSKFDDSSSRTSASSSSLLSSSPTLSTSVGKERSMPRLTFSETTSGGATSSVAFSPPLFKTSGHEAGPFPKTKSDMNLSRFLDNEYLHSGRQSLGASSSSAGAATSTSSGAKIPSSQSAANLTTLFESSDERQRNPQDKAQAAAIPPNASIPTESASNLSSFTTTASSNLNEPRSHASDTALAADGSSNGSLAQTSSDLAHDSSSAAASKQHLVHAVTAPLGRLQTPNGSSEHLDVSSSATVTSASSTSSSNISLGNTTVPGQNTAKYGEQTTHRLQGDSHLSNPIPSPRTFGAMFFATGLLCLYGTRANESDNNVVSANIISNGVRTYSEFCEALAATAKRQNVRPAQSRSSLATAHSHSSLESMEMGARLGSSTKDQDIQKQQELERRLPRAVSMSAMSDFDSSLNEDEMLEYSLHKVSSEAVLGLAPNSTGLRALPIRADVRVEWFDSVVIHDLAMLVPVTETLASHYTLRGASTSAVCELNMQAAKKARRKDLVKMWSILEVQTDPAVYPGLSQHPSVFDRPWAMHPLGKTLLNSIFRKYEMLGDVQTLAILSCVIAGPSRHYGVQWNFTPSELEKQSPSMSLHRPHHHRSASMVLPNAAANTSSMDPHSIQQPTSWRNTLSMGKPAPSIAANSANNRTLSSSHIGLLRDRGVDSPAATPLWNPSTLPPLAPSLSPPPPLTTSLSHSHRREDHAPHFSLVEHSKAIQYNKYRRFYAEILYMWGKYTERASIMKYVADPTPPNDGVDFVILCDRCSKPTKTPYCQNCKIYGFSCDICHLRVKGLSTFCLKCGHGGHADHVRKWFEKEIVCPSGCGCACKEVDS